MTMKNNHEKNNDEHMKVNMMMNKDHEKTMINKWRWK